MVETGEYKLGGMMPQLSFAHAEFAAKKKALPAAKSSSRAWRKSSPGRGCSPRDRPLRSGGQTRPARPSVWPKRCASDFSNNGMASPMRCSKTPLTTATLSRVLRGLIWPPKGVPHATTLLNFCLTCRKRTTCAKASSPPSMPTSPRGLRPLREGTLVDATSIAAPASTKNQERQRDPEMHQTKKGNQWYFWNPGSHRGRS